MGQDRINSFDRRSRPGSIESVELPPLCGCFHYLPRALVKQLVLAAVPPNDCAAVSLKQLFEDYAASGASSPRTVAKWRPHVAHFVDYLGHDDATKVTPADVNGWVKMLIAKPLAVKTVQDS